MTGVCKTFNPKGNYPYEQVLDIPDDSIPPPPITEFSFSYCSAQLPTTLRIRNQERPMKQEATEEYFHVVPNTIFDNKIVISDAVRPDYYTEVHRNSVAVYNAKRDTPSKDESDMHSLLSIYKITDDKTLPDKMHGQSEVNQERMFSGDAEPTDVQRKRELI
jgi:hypothetical protein